jgi:hypothetical protein
MLIGHIGTRAFDALGPLAARVGIRPAVADGAERLTCNAPEPDHETLY